VTLYKEKSGLYHLIKIKYKILHLIMECISHANIATFTTDTTKSNYYSEKPHFKKSEVHGDLPQTRWCGECIWKENKKIGETMKRNFGITAFLAILLFCQNAVAIQITATDISGGSANSNALSINNIGQIVGHINNESIAAYWNLSNGASISILETPGYNTPLFPTSTANGINDLGQVVGEYDNSKPWGALWNLSTGALITPSVTITNTGTVDTKGTNGGLFAINNIGQAVGEKFSLNPGVIYNASFWNLTSGVVINLDALQGGTNSHARGVNDLSQAVGYSDTASGAIHATWWNLSNGSIIDLGTLHGGSQSFAFGVNNLGQVVGAGDNDSGITHAILWDINTGSITDLGILDGGTDSMAFSINDMEQVVGSSTISGLERATLWNISDGTITDMGNIPGGTFGRAFYINNLGQAVGESGNSSGIHAALWTISTTPPTPSSLITKLVQSAQNLVNTGSLNKGQGNALIVKLQATTMALNRGNNKAAIDILHAFNDQVMAYNNAGILTTSDAQSLTNAVNNVIGMI
jgi:probable HAF family extracellular repeat protein